MTQQNKNQQNKNWVSERNKNEWNKNCVTQQNKNGTLGLWVLWTPQFKYSVEQKVEQKLCWTLNGGASSLSGNHKKNWVVQ